METGNAEGKVTVYLFQGRTNSFRWQKKNYL